MTAGPLVSLLLQSPFCHMAAPLTHSQGVLGQSFTLSPSPTNSAPYLADTGGTFVTTATEHSPVCIPLAMEKASHCREKREKQLRVSERGQLKEKGKKWVGGSLEMLTHSHDTPQHSPRSRLPPNP